MFDTLGPWMGMIVYLKMKDGKYVRELKLDEAEGSEELCATWIDQQGQFSTNFLLTDRKFTTAAVIGSVSCPATRGPWTFPDGWYGHLQTTWSNRKR